MSPSHTATSLESLMDTIRSEYREMPCMRLTASQFRRLWHLDSDVSGQVTAHLVEEGFLAIDHGHRLYWTARARR